MDLQFVIYDMVDNFKSIKILTSYFRYFWLLRVADVSRIQFQANVVSSLHPFTALYLVMMKKKIIARENKKQYPKMLASKYLIYRAKLRQLKKVCCLRIYFMKFF